MVLFLLPDGQRRAGGRAADNSEASRSERFDDGAGAVVMVEGESKAQSLVVVAHLRRRPPRAGRAGAALILKQAELARLA